MTKEQTKLIMMAILKGADQIATAIDQHRYKDCPYFADEAIEMHANDLMRLNARKSAERMP